MRARTSDISANIRENRFRVLIVAGGLSVVTVVPAVLLLNNRSAQSFTPNSSFEQARQLSRGRKEACLVDNQYAIDAVRKDDDTFEFRGKELSKFDGIVGTGIMDVPAGTNHEATINTYEDGIVKGTVTYEHDYGTYNYIIRKLLNVGEWEVVSMTACE